MYHVKTFCFKETFINAHKHTLKEFTNRMSLLLARLHIGVCGCVSAPVALLH